MDPNGNLYIADENTPQEDIDRANEWGEKQIEEAKRELEKKLREFESTPTRT